jgi:hypothetical protein
MIYEQQCYEAHRRIDQRHREAEAERNIRQSRARRQRRRRRAQLAAALDRLIYARAIRA